MDIKFKKIALIMGKIGISGGLILYLIEKSNIRDVTRIIGNLNIWWLLTACVLYIVSQVFSSWRWWVLLGRRANLRYCTSLYFIGCFFNSFMPTGIGGDGVKTYYLYKRGMGFGEGIASVFMDRYVGMAGMLVIGTAGYGLMWGEVSKGAAQWVWPGIVIGYIGGSIVLWEVRWGRLARFMRGFYEPLMDYKKRRGDVVRAFVAGLGVQIMGISSVWVIGRATGIELGFSYYAVVVPVASVLTMIPLSISGIGIREGTMVYMLGSYGVDKERALALSLAWFGVVLVVNMIGGIEFLRMGMMQKREEVQEINVPRGT